MKECFICDGDPRVPLLCRDCERSLRRFQTRDDTYSGGIYWAAQRARFVDGRAVRPPRARKVRA